MKKFGMGFLAGLMLGAVVPVGAATVVGNTGYLFYWSVTKDGDEICDSPYVWVSLKEIECD